MQSYQISARDYLRRAQQVFASSDPADLFYAALELRCGIEARMSEYLEVWDHISEKKKKGWRISEMHRNLEEAFRLGDKVVRWAVHNRESGKLLLCLYHTPVSADLKKSGERLGNYLHRMKQNRDPSHEWWSTFRKDLSDCVAGLSDATAGTLLGPPMMKSGTKQIDMRIEIPLKFSRSEAEELFQSGTAVTVRVDYLQRLPAQLEAEAVTWPTDS